MSAGQERVPRDHPLRDRGRPDHAARARLAAISLAAVALGPPMIRLFLPQAAPVSLVGVYQGGEGPFEAMSEPDGGIATGAAISAVRAGSGFAWVSVICPPAEALLALQVRLVRLTAEERIVAWSERVWQPGNFVCGPRISGLQIPHDAPSGAYELRRTLTLTLPGGTPEPQALPPIRITVLGVDGPGASPAEPGNHR